MVIGAAAGILSAFGYIRVSKFLEDKANLHDTCGVYNLHGIPGILGGIIGAFATSFAETSIPDKETLELTFPAIKEGRTTSEQAWYQLAALGMTILIAILGGTISGAIACCFGAPEDLFDDKEHFREADYIEEVEEKQIEMDAMETDRPMNDKNMA